MMSAGREFDIVLYGASGFTGRLVAEYFARRIRPGLGISWAIAGRNEARLSEVRDAVGAPPDLPLLVASGQSRSEMEALARRTRVILSTVGPFQLHGSELVAACARSGTDYADVCGEPGWMREMIDNHDATARAARARIVFSCGYDSIPFALGVFFLQNEAERRYGTPAPRVKGRVRAMQGSASGGTIASLAETRKAAGADPVLATLLRSPFVLTPGFEGPPQPLGTSVEYDHALKSWNAPFVMAPINVPNVHRTNFLLGHPWGEAFVYDEMILTGDGESGRKIAEKIAQYDLASETAIAAGEGPSRAEREDGFYDLLFIGEYPDGRSVHASVRGDCDPGYGSTSRMLAEAGIALLASDGEGGMWTPGALFGNSLIQQLQTHAGIIFTAGE